MESDIYKNSTINDTYLEIIASFAHYVFGQYVDVNYSLWIHRTVILPLMISFLLPCVFAILIYFTSLSLYVYKFHRRIIFQEIRDAIDDKSFWHVALKFVAIVWDSHARFWHGYEVSGSENLPMDGPALIIYYHGAIPIDMYYFVARIYLERNRLIYTVGDRFLSKLPGWAVIAEAMKVSPGSIKSCVSILNDGNQLAISPGGVYEAQFGNEFYELMWRRRMGFAKVAIESKVPIIPMFTENLREGFRSIGIAKRLFIKLYNFSRFPIRPIYGGFPVKFRTHLGKPIAYEPGITPEELQEKVANAIEDLILHNQRIPGSILQAFFDRFRKKCTPNVDLNSKQQRKYTNRQE